MPHCCMAVQVASWVGTAPPMRGVLVARGIVTMEKGVLL
jgi:hypothetical protein